MAQKVRCVEAHAGHDVARYLGCVDILPVRAAEADFRMTERLLDVDAERKHQRPVLDAHVVEHGCPDVQIGDMQRVAAVYHHQMRNAPYLAVLVQVQIVGLYAQTGAQCRQPSTALFS